MAQQQQDDEDQGAVIFPLVFIFGSLYVLDSYGPPIIGPHINWISTIAAITLFMGAMGLIGGIFSLLAALTNWKYARTATGHKGTAGWIKSLREIKHELLKGWGPYWGAFKGKPIFSDFESNALILGPARSGKGVRVLLITILTIFASKFWIDFKAEIVCVVRGALEARDEIIRILNIGNMYPDILGKTDFYNPLENIIFKCLITPGGTLNISQVLSQMSMQLSPEPKEDGGEENGNFWREGQRDYIQFAILVCVLLDGIRANLGDVYHLLCNRKELLDNALWIAGRLIKDEDPEDEEKETKKKKKKEGPYVDPMPIEQLYWVERHTPEDLDNFITFCRDLAIEMSDQLKEPDKRQSSSFLKGAKTALKPFNKSTHAYKCLSKSTFNFSEMKGPVEEAEPEDTDASLIARLVTKIRKWFAGLFSWLKPRPQAVNACVVLDAANPIEQGKIGALLQWCFQTEIKAHPNKKRRVYWIADEVTNYTIADLQSLLTWCGGYGLVILTIFQSFSAFISRYTRECFNTLLSETEIKLILPGTREPETLDLIEKTVGTESVMVQGHSSKDKSGLFSTEGADFKEDGRALKTADEARRTEKGILIIRKNKPIEVDLPTIAEVDPLREQIDINPFHGKPFIAPVKLRLPHPDGPLLIRLLKKLFAPKPENNGDHYA